jgi:hypothetical protein
MLKMLVIIFYHKKSRLFKPATIYLIELFLRS